MVQCFSPSTPQPARPYFCSAAAEELSQHVLEEHGGGSLLMMHRRSLIGAIERHKLLDPSYIGLRKKAVSWFTKIFAHHNLRDEWMVGALILLDRVTAAQTQPA